jgi:hypothetical protein
MTHRPRGPAPRPSRNARLGIYGGSTNAPHPDGTDTFQSLQEPKVDPVDDLSRFVMARIRELELEPRGEVMALYDEPGGAMAHRYAKHVRKDCVVFRRIAQVYLDYASDVDAGSVAESAMLAVANRWADHPDFDPDWRR